MKNNLSELTPEQRKIFSESFERLFQKWQSDTPIWQRLLQKIFRSSIVNSTSIKVQANLQKKTKQRKKRKLKQIGKIDDPIEKDMLIALIGMDDSTINAFNYELKMNKNLKKHNKMSKANKIKRLMVQVKLTIENLWLLSKATSCWEEKIKYQEQLENLIDKKFASKTQWSEIIIALLTDLNEQSQEFPLPRTQTILGHQFGTYASKEILKKMLLTGALRKIVIKNKSQLQKRKEILKLSSSVKLKNICAILFRDMPKYLFSEN